MVNKVPTYFYVSSCKSKTLIEQTQTFIEFAESCKTPLIADEKDGQGILPGYYTLPVREIQNIEYHQLLAIDMDTHDDSLKVIEYASTHNPILEQFNYVIYTTFSSVPDALRCRLLIEVDTSGPKITIDDYPAAIKTIEKMLNVAFDKCSYKRNSLFYMPKVKAAKGYLSYHFFTNVHTEQGRGFTHSDIKKEFYNTPAEKHENRDILGLHDQNQEYIPEETLRSMLKSIDPNESYDLWIKIMSGVHHYSNGADWGRIIINEWSANGKNYFPDSRDAYAGPDDVINKWDSWKNNPNKKLTTIGTVIYYANKNGWHREKIAQDYEALRGEIENNKEKFDNDTYTDNFCQRVSKTPLLKTQRINLIEIIAELVASLHGLKAKAKKESAIEIGKKCRFGGLLSELSNEQRFDCAPAWVKKYVHLMSSSTKDLIFIDITKPISPTTGRRDLNSVQIHIDNKQAAEKANISQKSVSEFLTITCSVPQVACVAFEPCSTTIFKRDGEALLNSFVADENFNFRPREKFTPEQLKFETQLKAFFEYFIPDPLERRIFMNFFAYCIFAFGKKVKWCPFIITDEGYGKDMMMNLLSAALGKYQRYYTKMGGAKFFKSQWTLDRENKAFIFVDEIAGNGGNGNNFAQNQIEWDTIKDELTEEHTRNVSAKYQNDRVIKQVTNYCFASNNKNAVRYSPTERRLFVINPDFDRPGTAIERANLSDVFQKIWQFTDSIQHDTPKEGDLNEANISLLREVLLSTVYEWFKPENVSEHFNPVNEAYRTKSFYAYATGNVAEILLVLKSFINDPKYEFACNYYVYFENVFADIDERVPYTIDINSVKKVLSIEGFQCVTDNKNVPTKIYGSKVFEDGAHGRSKPHSALYVPPAILKSKWIDGPYRNTPTDLLRELNEMRIRDYIIIDQDDENYVDNQDTSNDSNGVNLFH